MKQMIFEKTGQKLIGSTLQTLDQTLQPSMRGDVDHSPSASLEHEIFEWEVETSEYTAFLIVGNGRVTLP